MIVSFKNHQKPTDTLGNDFPFYFVRGNGFPPQWEMFSPCWGNGFPLLGKCVPLAGEIISLVGAMFSPCWGTGEKNHYVGADYAPC